MKLCLQKSYLSLGSVHSICECTYEMKHKVRKEISGQSLIPDMALHAPRIRSVSNNMVLWISLCTQYACSKRSEIDSKCTCIPTFQLSNAVQLLRKTAPRESECWGRVQKSPTVRKSPPLLYRTSVLSNCVVSFPDRNNPSEDCLQYILQAIFAGVVWVWERD